MKEFDFYIVPTPLGNLGDITFRAVEILHKVDYICCEDSRVTQKLLNHFNIKTKCISYHKYNEKERVAQIISLLEDGNKIALVSDAGTPLVCDPGSVIVEELRNKGFSITALPGANAVITFLSQIPKNDECFTFVGFLPKIPSQIENIVKDCENQNLVFYESPNRICDTLNLIKNVRPDAKIAIGRELTKVFEETIVDDIQNVINYFSNSEVKGEFVGMIYKSEKSFEQTELLKKIQILQAKNYSAKDIATILSELFDYNKNMIYKLAIGKKM